jgi:hypothetical protein
MADITTRNAANALENEPTLERQVTSAPYGHILTNISAWSPDSQWIVYDVRSDPAGGIFDGDRIERVNATTGEVEVLYNSSHGAHCGVVTCSPVSDEIVFILGPEEPTADWQYCEYHRRGVLVATSQPNVSKNLDARNLTPPFTPGALRGGSHVHVFSGDGQYVSFTYEDAVLAEREGHSEIDVQTGAADRNQRNIGIASRGKLVHVRASHPRNHDGTFFSALVTTTVNEPRPGSDEIDRAYSDAWIGRDGYTRPDGTRQHHAIAFLGDVITDDQRKITELFLVDIPSDITIAGAQPLEGTTALRPSPPHGTTQRRLTHTSDRAYPGLQGPRHWPRTSSDGNKIAFLMRDDQGIVQLWFTSPNGDSPRQATRHPFDIASTFSWHPDGSHVAYIADESVWVTDVDTGKNIRMTPRSDPHARLRPEACVFSPDGRAIAYVRSVRVKDSSCNQIYAVDFEHVEPATGSP